MINIKMTILVCFLLPLTFVGKAQEHNDYQYQQLIGEEYLDLSFTDKEIHFREGFLPGKVILNSRDSLANLQLRYNCYTDQLIWLSNIYGQVKLDKSIIKSFEITNNDSLFQFRQMKLAVSDSASLFYQVCHDGKVRLLVQRKVIHFTSYIKDKTHFEIFKPNPQYFLIINNNVFHLIRSDIKSIYLLFPELKERIQDRVKQMNLKDKKESDFIHFIVSIEDLLTDSR